jgi:hypothetical protein
MAKVKVLTVPQPRANELIFGDRFIENRSWPIDRRTQQARMPLDGDDWLYIFAARGGDDSCLSASGGLENGIIGRLKVYDVVRIEVLEILAALEPDATELTEDAARMVAHSERTVFFERHRHLLDFFRYFQITPEQFARQATGPVCWLVHEVQPLHFIAGRSKGHDFLGRERVWECELPEKAIVSIGGLVSSLGASRVLDETRDLGETQDFAMHQAP